MHPHTAVLGCACALLSGAALAAPTDFHRNIHGNLYQGGNVSGSFDYEFHYNIDPANVQPVADPASSAGHVEAYAPYSGFAYKFFVNLTLYDTGGTPYQYALNMPIYRFLVVNNVEATLGNPHDAFEIDTHSALGDIQFDFFATDASTLADTSLTDILTQQTFHDILAPANGSVNPLVDPAGVPTQWQFVFGQSKTVSGPIADLPTPASLPLVALGLGALAWVRGRPRLPVPAARKG